MSNLHWTCVSRAEDQTEGKKASKQWGSKDVCSTGLTASPGKRWEEKMCDVCGSYCRFKPLIGNDLKFHFFQNFLVLKCLYSLKTSLYSNDLSHEWQWRWAVLTGLGLSVQPQFMWLSILMAFRTLTKWVQAVWFTDSHHHFKTVLSWPLVVQVRTESVQSSRKYPEINSFKHKK